MKRTDSCFRRCMERHLVVAREQRLVVADLHGGEVAGHNALLAGWDAPHHLLFDAPQQMRGHQLLQPRDLIRRLQIRNRLLPRVYPSFPPSGGCRAPPANLSGDPGRCVTRIFNVASVRSAPTEEQRLRGVLGLKLKP
eukprot:1195857-Prorocentrum_minimum.AAC.10